jgi:hypothetical protein
VNTVSVVRRNLLNIAHFNSARDFSTAISARPAQRTVRGSAASAALSSLAPGF